MKLYYLIALLPLALFFSCNNNQDQTKEIDKTGSIEMALHTAHIDSLKDVLTTHYVIWNHGNKVREFDINDTIPSLGKTFIEAENNDGDTRDATVPRDYEFFVTVK